MDGLWLDNLLLRSVGLMADWKKTVISPDTMLDDAISKINDSGLQIAVVLDDKGILLGILTDGNIRRAILAKKTFKCPVSEIMNNNPMTVPESMPRDRMLTIMRQHVFHHLPIVDENKRLVGLVSLDDLIGPTDRSNWVVIMAGGQGKRLLPLTKNCPKPLLNVGGKPILESIVESFSVQGFKRLFLSVNYKAEMIINHFSTGDRWGLKIGYLHENTELGTAGSLSLLPEKPSETIIVMNGDLVTHPNFDNLLQFHHAQKAAATMVVREYDFQLPFGVVQLDGSIIQGIEEKPSQRFFVNAGIYALSPHVLDFITSKSFFDMPTLFEKLIANGEKTVAYPLHESWLDIGRIEEFEKARQEWKINQT